MIKSEKNPLHGNNFTTLQVLVREHTNIFCIGTCSGKPADITSLRVDLTPAANPHESNFKGTLGISDAFSPIFVGALLKNGMVYPKISSAWEGVPLLVPKSGPARIRFTVDLLPVNRLVTKYEYLMPYI